MCFCLITEGRTEQEKERLANLMAYGVDPNKRLLEETQRTPTPPREVDRFDECKYNQEKHIFEIEFAVFHSLSVVMEIEDRKKFLEEMTAIGRRKDYQQQIANEIAEV